MSRTDASKLGLQSETLQQALRQAVQGRPATLEDLLARHGAVLTNKPNLKLAAAFGVEAAALSAAVLPLLRRLGAEDAAPDTAKVFLPIAAAHGWAGRVQAGRDLDEAWAALGELAGDERAPVRVGTLDALRTLVAHEGGADELVAHALGWLGIEDRDVRYGAAAVALDVLADKKVMSGVRDADALVQLMAGASAEIADAPRSASRSDARRRLMAALPGAMAMLVANASTREPGRDWFDRVCAETTEPDLRLVLSDAIQKLRGPGLGVGAEIVDGLRNTLQGSAKPLRDPTRLRPGVGRGKASRRQR